MWHTIISESVFTGVVLKILSGASFELALNLLQLPQPLLEGPAVQEGPPVHVAACTRTLVLMQRWTPCSRICSFGRLVHEWLSPLL